MFRREGDFIESGFVLHSSGGLRPRRLKALDPQKVVVTFLLNVLLMPFHIN